VSFATPKSPNTFVAARLVQEASDYGFGWCVGFTTRFAGDLETDSPPFLGFRFSNFVFPPEDFAIAAGVTPVWRMVRVDGYDANSSMHCVLQDCNVRGGQIDLDLPYRWQYTFPAASLTWTNNLFDRVHTILIPTSYPDPLNIDFGFQAHNNLFRGGELKLYSNPAADGSVAWTLTDNLLDTVTLFQDVVPYLGVPPPINHGYNAYWQTTRLTPIDDGGPPDGIGDVSLPSAPPYQSSTFGDFYLPTTYQTFNAGSQVPAAIGMYHYTTRADQTKEGEEASGHKINIGLHYIAAANGLAKDDDSDGIPDYVENAAGDGIYINHVGAETDWQQENTSPGVLDSNNAIYDDVDLDGDGMVGRVEKALNGTNAKPLVPDNPLGVKQITTGEEPAVITVEVPLSYDSLASIGELELLVDGTGASFQDLERSSSNTCYLVWNSTYTWPSMHTLQAELVLDGQLRKGSEPDPTTLVALGPLVTLLTDNPLRFDPFYAEFQDGRGAIIHGDVAPGLGATSYSVELKTLAGDHIKTLSGAIGEDPNWPAAVHRYWDLTDEGGSAYTGDSAIAAVSLTIPNSPTRTLDLRLHDGQVIDDGYFNTAYAWDNANQAQGVVRDCIQHGVVDNLLTPASLGGGHADNYSSYYNAYTLSGWPPNPGYLRTPADGGRLLNVTGGLADYFTRNFHFDGHGNRTTLGDGSSIMLDAGAVAATLQNNWSPRTGLKRGHPYRFVFLNACETGVLPDWAHAFGVYDSMTPEEVADWPPSVQAFVGWIYKPRAPYTDAEWSAMEQTYEVFYGAWMSGYTLDQCIRWASSTHPGVPFDNYSLDFPLGVQYTFWQIHGWGGALEGLSNAFSLRVYGYRWIKRTGFGLP
jgi:hypothetical protein